MSKFETVEEFLKRGGKVTTLPTQKAAKFTGGGSKLTAAKGGGSR